MMKKQKGHTLKPTTEENNFNYFSEIYKSEVLDEIIKDVRRDNDSIILVDGAEGSGKSVLTACSLKYVDNSFNVDRVVFDGEELRQQAEALKDEKYKALQYDEAVTGLLSTDFMKDEFKNLIRLFSMGRKRNLIIFLVIPNISIFPQYIIKHRVSGLIHTYKDGGINRGYAKYYSKEKLEYLYYMLKQVGNSAYEKVLPSFRFRFTKPSVYHFNSFIDVEEYNRKKDEAIQKIGQQTNNIWKPRLVELLKYGKEKGFTIVEMSKVIGVDKSQVSAIMRGVA